jgi:hypothetical protein
LEHYLRLGVTRFHLIVHGGRSENTRLYQVANAYPVRIRDEYDGPYMSEEKARRTNSVLASLPDGWTLVVDSDEFVELPYAGLARTARVLERVGASALFAPLLQRLAPDYRLETSEVIEDPFTALPLCSVGLYGAMGVIADSAKYPLFVKSARTEIEGGNHHPPNGRATLLSGVLGVTHHFKWRRSVVQRLMSRANSAHTWRHESAGFLAYLSTHEFKLPGEGTFAYSRQELFRRGLLRRASRAEYWARSRHLAQQALGLLRRKLG